MSKSKLALDTIVSVEASARVAAPAKKPYSINIIDPMPVALQKLAILVRQGYTPAIDVPCQVFSSTGVMSLTVVLGSPDEAFAEAAAESVAHAVALEQMEYTKAVAQEASRQIAEAARLAAEAKRAALVATQRAQIAALEAEITAASK